MEKVIPATEPKLVTGAEFALLPDTDGCELIEGRVGPMSPPPAFNHCRVEGNVYFEIRLFVDAHNLGIVAVGEAGLYTQREPDTVRGADVVFISHARHARRDKSKAYLDVAPDLIAEVLSPSNRADEIDEKLQEYFAIGVRLVWIVDPELRRVLAFRSPTDVRQFTDDRELPGDDVLPGLSIPVARFFS